LKIDRVEYAGTLVDPLAPLPEALPQVAFSGRSNVGKSSLINTLLRRTRKKLAHVSSTPGKTQALNFFRVNERFFLVDLPGFGFAQVPAAVREGWQELIEGYLARDDGPLGAVHLVDIRRDPTATDLQMLEYLASIELPTLVVFTKVDKLTHSERTRKVGSLATGLQLELEQVIPFSSKTGEGREELLEALDVLLGAGEKIGGAPADHGGARQDGEEE
jgi:GTP-binding protein